MHQVRNELMKNHFNWANIAFDMLGYGLDILFIARRWFKVAISKFVAIYGTAIFRLWLFSIKQRNLQYCTALFALYAFTCAFVRNAVPRFALKAPNDDRHGPLLAAN